ncbi:pre-60S factor rei1 [Malassezia equina]|uniref:Pre-60S factor rei1 n=1 Tax=Malassezia equina TaxID=1381935 RepID=A0AAF0IZ17_9BASI|nr:pre-60S factor rei1 [Malassezia equina]
MSQVGGEDVYTCITCSVAFYTAPEQRDHFRSDLHRYNMKRRVANLAPVSAAVFNAKILERRAAMESSEKATQEDTGRCKSFASQNAYRDHMQSRKHREMVQKQAKMGPSAPKNDALSDVQAMRRALPDKQEDEDEEEDENLDEEARMERAIQRKLAKARRIDPATECMFCSESQASLEASVQHMQHAHGFFVPERKYLTDLNGLLRYLADKVSVGNVCLWCNGRGRGFHDVGAVQKHMMDKSHCKVAYDTQEDQLELSDFYDFRSSYADYTKKDDWEDVSDDTSDDGDQGAVWEEASDDDIPENNGIRYGDSELELVLPSGARLGHRSLQRYYRQTLWQTPASQQAPASTTNGRALAHRIAGHPQRPVVTARGSQDMVVRNRGEAKEAMRHVREVRDVQRRELFKTKVGFRHNHQKHYRDPLLQ